MKIYIAISILLSFQISANEIDDMIRRNRGVFESKCASQNWSQKQCHLNVRSSSSYVVDPGSENNTNLQRRIGGGLNTLSMFTGIGGQALNEALQASLREEAREKGRVFRRYIRRRVRSISSGLNTCQKACLVKCAVNHIIQYEDSALTTFWGQFQDVNFTYGFGRALCSEFAEVARDLTTATGIRNARVRSTSSHAFLEVREDGRSLVFEPTSSACVMHLEQGTSDEDLASINAIYNPPRNQSSAPPTNPKNSSSENGAGQ